MPRPESVRRAPDAAPFHHPYYETPRQRQFRALKREAREFVAACEAMRARLASVRVLEAA